MADTALALSVVLYLALTMIYLIQPDAFAAITVFPVWVWLVPGLTLAGLGWRPGSHRRVAVVSSAWCLVLLVMAEEPTSLLRSLTSSETARRAAERRHEAVRVVSSNCAVGNPNAAREVVTYHPDIVLLQESPSRDRVEALANQLYGVEGSVVHGPDASLIVRGTLIPADLPPKLRSYFVQARVRLASGIEVEVVSVRFVPAVFRLDLWSPQCWCEQAENRNARREQVDAIVRRLKAVPEAIPVILGGDLNAPQGDAAFRPFLPRLRDTFHKAGRGWGNTMINELPFLRIDQIWSSRSVCPLNVVARTTRHSDHRMVISDLVVSPR
jgi:endonuclease/exonuclease/phosphatase (EEP) superfamily protein YafD